MKTLLAALFLVIATVVHPTLDAEDEALELVRKTGLTGGIIFLPQVQDSQTAVSLAEKTPFTVYAQSTNQDLLDEIRERGEAAGILTTKLYTGFGPSDHLPLAPHSVSIVLAHKLEGGSASPQQLQAWVQALSPERGLAIVAGQVGSNSADNVEAFGKGLVCVRKPAIGGTDSWPHKFHDAANTRTTRDETLKPPFLPAWYALPTNLGYWGDTMISDRGRCYYIHANRAANASVSLVCFDIRNGAKLWIRPFQWSQPRQRNNAGYNPGRSCMVAYDEALYFIDEDSVRKLDGETGEEKSLLAGPKADGQVKWIAEGEGILAMLAGDPDTFSTSSLQNLTTTPFGSELAAYELVSEERLWSHTEEGPIDEREIAIRDGYLYYHVRNKRVVCRNLKTGDVEWEQRDPEILKLLAPAEMDQSKLHATLFSSRSLIATPDVLYFASVALLNRVALGADGGQLLWSEPIGRDFGRALPDVIFGEDVFRSTNGVKWGGEWFRLASGERLPTRTSPPKSGCGPSFAGPDYFVTAFGGISDRDGTVLRQADLKSACEIGTVISGGVAFNAPGICRCALEVQGYRAFTWGEDPAAESSIARLQTFPSGPRRSEFEATELDWPAFRQNNRRSGSTGVSAPASAPTIRWAWKPGSPHPVRVPAAGYGAWYLDDPDYLPTQSLAVQEVAYFGDHQGVIRAVSIQDGSERWSSAIGTRLLSPPAYERGRIVCGGMDGYVHCLDAGSGQLLWKYRVPPRERRIMWYGHLNSTWPLCGGVIVENEVVYAVAGFQSGYGVFGAALRLEDGGEVWRSQIPATELVGAMGGIVLADGKLFFQTGADLPAAFDLKTGEPGFVPPFPFAGTSRRGKGLAALSDNWLVYGGPRIYATFDRWRIDDRSMGFSICRTDLTLSEGEQVCLGADLAEPSLMMPVFDDELLIAGSEYPPRNGKPRLLAWTKSSLQERVEGLKDAAGGKRQFLSKRAPYSFNTLLSGREPLPAGGIWEDVRIPVLTAVLCKNALLAVHPRDGDKQDLENWQLSALKREDGSVVWTVDLPQRPVWDGLSVAADGSILVAMWDGSLVCLK